MENNLRSLSSLFTEPLRLETGNVNINSVLIPKIQRAYAQGRRSEAGIREGFLTELFSALVEDKRKELNFIYGSVDIHAENDTRLILLDGQQRLTTLWLLTWYLHTREQKQLPRWMTTDRCALFYDTRDTTSEFTRHLATERFDFPSLHGMPSEEICKSHWLSGDLRDDPSVDSMLRMIDSIHEFYERYLAMTDATPADRETTSNLDIADNLDNIQFYVQPLENFGLTEDLYVKMNARGLQLRPFENFKADLVEWTKRNESPSVYNRFVRLLDRELTDLFYSSVPENPDPGASPQKMVEYYDKEFNARFFRFFIRYFVWCRALDSDSVENTRVFIGKGDPHMYFFYEKSEKEQNERYLGFTHYSDILTPWNYYASDTTPCRTSIEAIGKVLTGLNELKGILKELVTPVWIDSPSETADMFAPGLQQRPFTVLGGLFSFLSRIPAAESAGKYEIQLKRWMRVVNNIAENTDIDNLAVMSNVMRQLDELASLPGFTRDVYGTIASAPTRGNTSRATLEEIRKAAYIAGNDEWETLFKAAESHKFLRGMIIFFFPDDVDAGMTKSEFLNRLDRIKEIFDDNGISEEFRRNAILIRAMIAELSVGAEAWDDKIGIKKLNLSQYDGADRSLRNNLSGLNKVSEMMRRLTALKDKADVVQCLEQIISQPITAEYPAHPEWTPYLRNAVDTLLHSLPLYKWIEEERSSNAKRIVRIDWAGDNTTEFGQILVAVPRAWYAKVNIDTNRQDVMKLLVEQHGFTFWSQDEADFMERFNNVFDTEVWLSRDVMESSEVEGTTRSAEQIILKFTRNPTVEVHLSGMNETTGPATLKSTLYPDANARFDINSILTAVDDCIHQDS